LTEGESMQRVPSVAERSGREGRRLCVPAVAAAAGLLVAGCVSTQVAPPPAPTLQLLEAGTLEVPPGCEPAPGAVYRPAYVVQTDGRVEAAAPEPGLGCVEEALRQWVATFRYRPVDEATEAVLDWMSVTAPRGG
jgi:hypothetical protein